MDLRSSQAPSAKGASVKGVAFQTVMTVVAQKRSQGAVDAALAQMPAEAGDALRYKTIIASGWYPIGWYRELWSGICASTGEGEDFVRAMGRAAVDHDFNTLYRTLVRMLSPRTLVTTGLKHFSRFYDTGTASVTEARDNSVRIQWTGCVGFDRNLWIEAVGSCERLAELAGGKGARGFIQEGGDGDRCVAVVRWQ